MPKQLLLAAIASLFLTAQATARAPTTPQKFNVVLCQTEDEAMAFAEATAAGKTEPIAINLVNKAARAKVCGRYIGYAVVEIEKTENYNGGLFMLTGLRFSDDGRLGWTAGWVVPFDSPSLKRAT